MERRLRNVLLGITINVFWNIIFLLRSFYGRVWDLWRTKFFLIPFIFFYYIFLCPIWFFYRITPNFYHYNSGNDFVPHYEEKYAKKIVLTDNLDFEQKIDINQYVDKIGITTTMLKPIGFVKFDSDTLEVCSQSGLIAPNTKVKVTEIKNKKIFVERI